MRVVDTALFTALEAAGFHVPALYDGAATPPVVAAGTIVIHDGLVTVDASTNVVTYPLPYAVYHSSIGADGHENPRLIGRHTRRSVFFSLMYVGADRTQAKWLGEDLRDAIQDNRFTIPGYRSWPAEIDESQRIRRDDDAIRPDGSPLFYGVSEGALSIMLTHQGVLNV